MKVINTIQETREIVKQWKKEGLSVGLVPTMGYLHNGHGSLIKKCKEENHKVVVSIFVNPTQFGANEDLSNYPRDLERDTQVCESFGADLIFHPEVAEVYDDEKTYVNIEGLSSHLCGQSRPTHFRGVCTIVSKLFNIVNPDAAYFGEKDAQQLAIIKKMTKDLNFDIKVVGCPIIREEDGLAVSSRNVYLNEEERKAALCLSKAIRKGQEVISINAKASDIVEEMSNIIKAEPLAKIDYIQVVDSMTMNPVEKVQSSVLVAMAVVIGKTRLIDNFIWEV